MKILNKLAEKLIEKRQRIKFLKERLKKQEAKETGIEEALFKLMLQSSLKSFKYLDDTLFSLSTKKHYFIKKETEKQFFEELIKIEKKYLLKTAIPWQALQGFMNSLEENTKDKKNFLYRQSKKEFKIVSEFLDHTERKTISIRGLKTRREEIENGKKEK